MCMNLIIMEGHSKQELSVMKVLLFDVCLRCHNLFLLDHVPHSSSVISVYKLANK